MLSKLFRGLYIADLTAAICLLLLCMVDAKLFDAQMFPSSPNAWTWALWATVATAIVIPGALLAVVGIIVQAGGSTVDVEPHEGPTS